MSLTVQCDRQVHTEVIHGLQGDDFSLLQLGTNHECEERQLEFGTLRGCCGNFLESLRVTLVRTPSDEGYGI